VPEEWQPVVAALASMLDQFAAECREFVQRTKQEIIRALSNATSSETIKIKLSFNFHIDGAAVQEELARLQQKKGDR